MRGLKFRNFEITKREILASASIIAILFLVGFMLSSKISEHHLDEVEKYNKAAKINDKELFRYGVDTNIGYAVAYGELKAVDTVTYPEIGGEYMYVEKVKQRYTRHTRRVKTGKTYHTQVYWTWDTVGTDSLKCKAISFCDVKFDSVKINPPSTEYIDTIKESSHIRYKYYGTAIKHTGTVFTLLKNNTINDTTFYKDKTIKDVEDIYSSNWGSILFWIAWIILIGICVFAFVHAKNKWLE